MGFSKPFFIVLLFWAMVVVVRGQQSPDGTCGPSSGGNYTCGNLCCSQYGWCGTTADHCGVGCQEAYGTCGGGTPLPAPPGTPAAPGLEMKSCVEKGQYALTFDDGPSNMTMDVINTLAKLKLKATFFVLGEKLVNNEKNQKFMKAFRAAYLAGHLVGSHSFDHPHFPDLTVTGMEAQLNKTSDIFKELIGVKPRYFRAPYGEISNDVIDLLKKYGYNLINWNLDPRDWESLNETLILKEIETALDSGTPATDSWIDVKHDTVPATVFGLEKIVRLIQSKGYQIVSLPDCVGDKQNPYTQ